MPVLAGWSIGSIAAGLFWLRGASEMLKGFASQMIGWGVVDLVIALLGLRGAARNAVRYASREISEAEHAAESRKFERILAVNAALDIGYIAGGVALARQPSKHRQGMGWGIIVQGLYLLIWDTILVILVRRKFNAG